ncbi:MAG: CHAT domain-containing protein [Bacteroidetes bacterium]|nr:MAG: CHAT domain-containing protein [Bacteroidota bacterium]
MQLKQVFITIVFILATTFFGLAENESGNKLFETGYVHYIKGEYAPALESFQQFIDLEIKQPEPRRQKMAMMHRYRAHCFEQLQLNYRAISENQKAMQIYEELNDSLMMANSYQKLGELYFHENKLEQASLFFNGAVVIFEKMKWIAQIQKTLFHLGEIEFARSNLTMAKLNFQKSLNTNQNYGMASEYAYLEGETWFNLAKIAIGEDSLSQAKEAIQKAENIFRINVGQLPQFYKQLTDLLIFKSENLEHKNQAWKNLQEAENLVRMHPGFTPKFKVEIAKARFFIQYKEFVKAESLVNQLKNEMDRFFESAFQTDYPELILTTAKLYQEWYSIDRHVGHLEKAFQVLEDYSTNQVNPAEVYSLLRDRTYSGTRNKQILDQTISAAARLFQFTGNETFLTKAFFYAEQFSIAIFTENLELANQENNGAINEDTEIEKALIKLEINNLIAGLSDDNQVATEKRLTLIQLINRLENIHISDSSEKLKPDVYEPEKLVAQLQETLTDSESYLRFYETEEEIFQFLVTKSDIEFRWFNKTVEFEQARKQYSGFISNTGAASGLPEIEAFAKASNTLFRQLILPFGEKLSTGDLIIDWPGTADKILFETLLVSLPANISVQLKHLPWLIFEKNIRYSASVTQFCKIQSNPSSPQPVFYAGFAPYADLAAKTRRKLQSSGKEVKTLARIFNGKHYVAKKSTKEVLQSYAGKTTILHLATHAQNHDLHPQLAELSFWDKKGNAEKLYFYEIQNSKWETPLVILGACGTATGEYIPNYGTVSLANAFLSAGVQTVVGANWEASDFVSSQILSKTAENMKSGLETSEALRQAKIEFLSQSNDLFSQPFYWAVYTCHGKPLNLIFQPDKWKYRGILVIVFSVFVVLFVLYLFQKFIRHGKIFR